MIRWYALMALCLATGISAAQNLVVNPGFEEYYKCPNNFSTSGKDFNLPGWRSPSTGTPDYFNACSWGDCDVPFNWAGESNPHEGRAYAGVYVWNKPNSKPRSYREYIQGQLKSPLIAGKRYLVSFYFKVASYSVYSVDRVGLLLTDSAFTLTNDQVIERKPNLSVVRDEPFSKNAWELAQIEWTAKGGEQFITIGNFFDNLTTQFVSLDNRKGKSPMLTGSAYLYIDDVSVVLLNPDPPPVPLVSPEPLRWSDGTEVKEDESYVLKNIQFEFDRYVLLPVSFSELDKLVDILLKRPEWKAELDGHTDDVGSEAYNLELSRNRAQSVGAYLQSKGIDPTRLIIHGYGKTKPLMDARDEQSRMLNRRVEVRFIR